MAKKDWLTGTWAGTTRPKYSEISFTDSEYHYNRRITIATLETSSKDFEGWRSALLYDNKNWSLKYNIKYDKIIGRIKAKSYALYPRQSDVVPGDVLMSSGKIRMNMKSGKFKLWNNDAELVAKGKIRNPKEIYPHPTGICGADEGADTVICIKRYMDEFGLIHHRPCDCFNKLGSFQL